MNGYIRNTIRQKIIDSQAARLPEYTRRDIRIPNISGKAVAIIGMRRTGKSTFMRQIMSDKLKQGAPEESILYFSFEDERLADMQPSDLELIVEEFYRLQPHMRDSGKTFFFLDEIQVVKGWELFVRRLLDTENIELYLSGSSSRMLSKEVATSMRGRALETTVYPFSFREYLRHRGMEPAHPPERWNKAERSAIDHELADYLQNGGFPETIGIEEPYRRELLRSYIDVALLLDVIERHNITNPLALRWMVRHLLGNAAGSFSINRFHNDLKSQGLSVAKDTLHAYLGHLEDAFLLHTISVATGSERRRMVNPRKIYPADTSLIPLYERHGKENTGHALETAVYLELARRGYQTSYIRTTSGYEVDFYAQNGNETPELIQVCATLDDPIVRKRETRALHEAAKEFTGATLRLITLTPLRATTLPETISSTQAIDWLLNNIKE